MNYPWKIKIHRLVVKEDFKFIGRGEQGIIIKNIRKKLSVDPEGYGKALSGELKGYWRLRVGDYRVIYKIQREIVEVLVIKVGMRRDEEVYKDFFFRLKKLQSRFS